MGDPCSWVWIGLSWGKGGWGPAREKGNSQGGKNRGSFLKGGLAVQNIGEKEEAEIGRKKTRHPGQIKKKKIPGER